MILELPTTLADRYEVSRFLGAGSFAETYAARDSQSAQDVAIKVLRPTFVNDHSTLTRFEREAQATTEIVHPNVVRTLDYSMEDPHPFIVMEYVSGPDLKALLQENGRFTQEQAVTYTVQALAGLEAIHQTGMVHRDIKPHNILIDPEHGARLSDFGIARALDQPGLTRTGIALGTASYMSPEQATGREVTPATDLYAVGVMLFEMLAGRTPFQGDDPLEVLYQQVHQQPPSLRELNPEVPEWLERIALRAMAKEPAARYTSADSMVQALNSADGSADETRLMDPALIAAQAATAAMPVRPAPPARERRNVRAVPEHKYPGAAPPPPNTRTRKGSGWYRTPAFILLALLLMVGAIAGLYALGTGAPVTDDEPGTVIDEPTGDEVTEEEVEPEAPDPPAEEEPAEPEAPDEDPDPAPVDDSAPDPAPDEDAPDVENETDDDSGNGNAQGQGQGQGQGQEDDHPGQGQDDGPPGQSDDNPGQGNN